MQFFAVSAPGLEKLLLGEMKEAGIAKCKVEEGGVAFSGDNRVLYKSNLHLRTASRILVRVARFHASAFHELERNATRVRWSEFVSPGMRVALRVTCRKSKLYHSDAVAERIARVLSEQTGALVSRSEPDPDADAKPAVIPANKRHPREGGGGIQREEKWVPAFAGMTGEAPPSQLFVIRLFHDECTISADSSGAHLHMRGYREALAKAPLRETLAATLIRASGWHWDAPLVDPMCGAGTIAIEAALIARRIPAGLSRSERSPRPFAFESWPGHDSAAWKQEVDAARSHIIEHSPVRILASDRDAGAIQAALSNAARAGVENDIEVEQRAISDIARPDGSQSGSLLCNPPYGKRVGEEAGLRNLYARFGNLLRSDWSGWRLTMLSGNSKLARQMRLDFQSVARTSNGGIPVELIRADII